MAVPPALVSSLLATPSPPACALSRDAEGVNWRGAAPGSSGTERRLNSSFLGPSLRCRLGDSKRIFPELSCPKQHSRKVFRSSSLPAAVAMEIHEEGVWPLNDSPMKRRKRFGQAVEKMKKDAKKVKKDVKRGITPPPLVAPQNGLLVEALIPVAHQVMEARTTVREGVRRMLKDLPAFACSSCPEVCVGPTGHQIRSCTGKDTHTRGGSHMWIRASMEDLVSEVETYHLRDRLLSVIRHENRMKVDRIPAVVELCIQAGVDVPEYKSARRSTPYEMEGERIARLRSEGERLRSRALTIEERLREETWKDAAVDSRAGELQGEEVQSGESDDESCPESESDTEVRSADAESEQISRPFPSTFSEALREHSQPRFDVDGLPPIGEDPDLVRVAERTLQAWLQVREGVALLMHKYEVRTCGYCPEVHVGPKGHKVRLCNAAKHQWRRGQHGWQDAILDDILPPKFVYHLREREGPPLLHELRNYYGMAPAVVEICVQAGAPIPEQFQRLMRRDVAVPDLEELERIF